MVYRSLETALTKAYARQYDAGPVLRQIAETSDDGSSMYLQVDYQKRPGLLVELAVTHHGGPNYEVLCSVETGSSRRFSYSVPRHTGTRLSRTPYLGQKLAEFLLSELEKHLGHHVLTNAENGTAA